MTEHKVTRKLAAVVSADVAGYSRLMGEDEAGTLAAMKAHKRELWTPQTEAYGGRVVGGSGDSILIEFASAVAAVECSVAVQRGMAERNAGLPESRRMQLRVGVNLGEVIVDGDDIYGDGINVAARLEQLAEPGGISISDDVHRQVEGKTELLFRDAGLHEVKNIARPVHVWQWRDEAPAAQWAEITGGAPLPLPDKPSIAVLPFDNMSGDPEQEYFSDGITEDIITALSRMPWFFVIARNSTFTYKGKAANVTQVARELGVRYVLEGSVRKAGQRLRVTAQLIDADSGKHVWAERYDRDLEDIFAVQDEVTESIVGAVAPEFLSVEARRARRKDPSKLDAWELVMRGRSHLWRLGRDDLAEARHLFERAIELAPSGEFGASDLAVTHLWEFLNGWSENSEQTLQEMVRVARMAVSADDHDAWAQTALGVANVFARRWNEALHPVDRAIELNPSFAPAVGFKGVILSLLGEPDAGLVAIQEAIRLSPRDPTALFWLAGQGVAHYSAGRYEQTVEAARRMTQLAPDFPTGHRQLAAACAMLGRMEEARAALAEVVRLIPGHTASDVRARLPMRDPEHLERFVEGLRKAGLPD